MSKFYLLALLLAGSIYSLAQDNKKSRWVDSVFSNLRKDEKIGQLFLVPISTNTSKEEVQALVNQCKAGKIGGLFIQRSGAVGYAKMINRIQSQSKIPLFTTADVSGDLTQTFDSTMSFYNSIVLNAIINDTLLNELDSERARQIKILGIHFNLKLESKSSEGLQLTYVPDFSITNSKSKKGEVERQAFLQANDLLIAPKNVDAAIKAISKATKKDKALATQLDHSVKKILSKKYDVGLSQNKFIDTDNLFSKLHSTEAQLLKQHLAEAAVTLVQNDS